MSPPPHRLSRSSRIEVGGGGVVIHSYLSTYALILLLSQLLQLSLAGVHLSPEGVDLLAILVEAPILVAETLQLVSLHPILSRKVSDLFLQRLSLTCQIYHLLLQRAATCLLP